MSYNMAFFLVVGWITTFMFNLVGITRLTFILHVIEKSCEEKKNRHYTLEECASHICTNLEKKFFDKNMLYTKLSWRGYLLITSILISIYISIVLGQYNITGSWMSFLSISFLLFYLAFIFAINDEKKATFKQN